MSVAERSGAERRGAERSQQGLMKPDGAALVRSTGAHVMLDVVASLTTRASEKPSNVCPNAVQYASNTWNLASNVIHLVLPNPSQSVQYLQPHSAFIILKAYHASPPAVDRGRVGGEWLLEFYRGRLLGLVGWSGHGSVDKRRVCWLIVRSCARYVGGSD